MKKYLPTFIIILFCLISPIRIFSQDDRCDAVYLSLTKTYTLNPDGSMDYRYEKKLKLQTYRSFQNLYGETFIVYNPEYQQLKINEFFTLTEDGKKVVGPANALNEVLPGFAANAPAYNTLREMVVTHTGLERTAVENLDYQIHTVKDFYPALMGNEVLPESEPVKELKIIIRVPAGTKLFYRIVNAADPVVKTMENGYQVYRWTFFNLSPISAEAFQTGNNALYPRLVFSNGSPEEVFSFLTHQEAFRFGTDDSMKKEIENLKTLTGNPLEISLKLQEKVVNDLRLYPVPFVITGYKSRTAVETWNSNGGTPAEKMILLTALLREAGIKADPVLIAKSGIADEKEGNLATTDEFAVRIELKEEGTLYLQVTGLNAQDLLKTLPGSIFMILSREGKPTFVRSGEPEFRADVQGTFICSSDPKITGEISVTLKGAANPFLGLSRDKNKIRNSLSGGISGPDLKEAKITESNPESTFQRFTVQAEKPFRKDSSFYFFSIPVLKTGIESWGIHTLSSRRETSFEIAAPATENYEYSILFPENMKVFTPLKKTSVSNNAGDFLLDLQLEKGKLIIKKSIQFKEKTIGAGDYPGFKALMDLWNDPWNGEVVFRKEN